MVKRLLDLLVAAVGLLVTSPLLALIGLAVWVGDRGPVFFRQRRVGRYGREFEILKFRSMTQGSGGPSVTAGGDMRITRVGHVLRASKLDELPQLVNVLRGDMSLVGPRPEVPEYVMLWPEDARIRVLSVRPGITDPASIRFRDEATLLSHAADPFEMYEKVILPAKVAIYDDYVASASVIGDLVIILRTMRTLMSPRSRGIDYA